MNAQMKKGVLEMCILNQLHMRDMYGYEIMAVIKEAFADVYEGTVYTILRRMHASRYTDTYMGDVSGGPIRKYYRVTPSGKQYLEESIAEWNDLTTAVRALGIE